LSAPVLRLELAPSPALAAALVALHLGGAACTIVALPGAAGWLLALAIAGLGVAAAWSRALLRSPTSARALELRGAALSVELASGETLAGDAAGRRYVNRWLVTLPLQRRTLLVTAGMLEPAAFRRLRIWALWGRLPV
jgi:hypothetical protein